jgi:hypothetical protein
VRYAVSRLMGRELALLSGNALAVSRYAGDTREPAGISAPVRAWFEISGGKYTHAPRIGKLLSMASARGG